MKKKTALQFFVLGIALWLSLIALPVQKIEAQVDLVTCVNAEGLEYEAESCDLLPPSEITGDIVQLSPEHDFVMPQPWRCQRLYTFWRPSQTNWATIAFTQATQMISYDLNYNIRLNEAILAMNAAGISLGQGDMMHIRVVSDAWWETTTPQARTILKNWVQNGAFLVVETEFSSFGGYALELNNLLGDLGVTFSKRMGESYVVEPNPQWWVSAFGSSTLWDKWFSSYPDANPTYGRGNYYATSGFNTTGATRELYSSPTSQTPVMVEEDLGLGLVRIVGDTSFQQSYEIQYRENVAQEWATQMACEKHVGAPTAVTLLEFQANEFPDKKWGLLIIIVLSVVLTATFLRRRKK